MTRRGFSRLISALSSAWYQCIFHINSCAHVSDCSLKHTNSVLVDVREWWWLFESYEEMSECVRHKHPVGSPASALYFWQCFVEMLLISSRPGARLIFALRGRNHTAVTSFLKVKSFLGFSFFTVRSQTNDTISSIFVIGKAHFNHLHLQSQFVLSFIVLANMNNAFISFRCMWNLTCNLK